MLIQSHAFSFKKMHLIMSSGKWRPFRFDLNVLKNVMCCLYDCIIPIGCTIHVSFDRDKMQRWHTRKKLFSSCDGHSYMICKYFFSIIFPFFIKHISAFAIIKIFIMSTSWLINQLSLMCYFTSVIYICVKLRRFFWNIYMIFTCVWLKRVQTAYSINMHTVLLCFVLFWLYR